jgi:RHS repeat-associated protein
VAPGLRLATLDASGALVRATTVVPTLADPYTARFTLTAAEWTTLTATPAATLSVAARNTLRAQAWSSGLPLLPPPDWVQATKPVFTSSTYPVEVRESLASLAAWLPTATTAARPLYEVPALALAASAPPSGAEGTLDQLLTARFQALPFADPATGLVYARARWYDAETGNWLTVDPLGYGDSANLYAYAGGDPVNGRDPTGLAVATTADGSFYVTNPKNGKRYLLPIKWVRENQLSAQDVVQYEGGLSADETKDWMYGHGLKFTHPYDRPVIQKALPNGDHWWMNGLIATSGLPPQNRQQEIVQGGLQIAGTAAMVIGGAYGNEGMVSAQPVFETRAGVQVGVNDFMDHAYGPQAPPALTPGVSPFEQYKRDLAMDMGKPIVKDPELAGIMEDLYRSDATLWSGSTADAVRYERLNGKPVGGRWHSQKASEEMTRLSSWMRKNPEISSDRAAAELVYRDLQRSLSTPDVRAKGHP